jgi:asparagine synthase (glutamine-hydrolysing)
MGTIIAVINKKGENATETAVAMLKILKHKNIENFGIASPTTVKTEKSIEALQEQNVNSLLVIGHASSKILTTEKLQPMKLENATLAFEGRIYRATTGISAAEAFAKKIRENREKITEILNRETEGDFTFAIAEHGKIIAGRNVMGVYPLYFGENVNFVALASERKVLWRIGIKNVNSFPPGSIAFVDENGFKLKPVKTLAYSGAKQITMQAAAEKLQTLLQRSVKQRVSGLKEAAVAFSGGLDSSIIACLAKNSGADVHLIHVSLENHQEVEYAKKAAEELELPIHVYLYNEDDVEKVLQKVLWLIEESDPIKTSIGIPLYWTAERAAAMNFKVMLAGQGADELFGGYRRYINDYLKYGSEKLHKILFNDILKMHETNFERDFKICNFHNVELRLPFATYKIAKFATELPVELKIKKASDGLRKLVVRQVAENLLLPQYIVNKPKKAIQYTTGVNETLKKISSKAGLSMKEYLQKTFQIILKKMVNYE